jgi:hypothetical protein
MSRTRCGLIYKGASAIVIPSTLTLTVETRTPSFRHQSDIAPAQLQQAFRAHQGSAGIQKIVLRDAAMQD